MSKQQPVFVCQYRDGTIKIGSYAQTLKWFNKAQNTDNPCLVTMPETSYKAP